MQQGTFPWLWAIIADVLETVNPILLSDACNLQDFIKALIEYTETVLLVCLNVT